MRTPARLAEIDSAKVVRAARSMILRARGGRGVTSAGADVGERGEGEG